MSGVLFSDTFDLETVDYDPVLDKKEKKFDKGNNTDSYFPLPLEAREHVFCNAKSGTL